MFLCTFMKVEMAFGCFLSLLLAGFEQRLTVRVFWTFLVISGLFLSVAAGRKAGRPPCLRRRLRPAPCCLFGQLYMGWGGSIAHARKRLGANEIEWHTLERLDDCIPSRHVGSGNWGVYLVFMTGLIEFDRVWGPCSRRIDVAMTYC